GVVSVGIPWPFQGRAHPGRYPRVVVRAPRIKRRLAPDRRRDNSGPRAKYSCPAHTPYRRSTAMGRTVLAVGVFAATLTMTPAAPPPLIPRDVLFGNPDRAGPQISPDGKRLAYLRPDDKNVLQVWVRTLGQNDD